jgi:hypothetical protein
LFIYIQRVGLNESRVALGAFNDVCFICLYLAGDW